MSLKSNMVDVLKVREKVFPPFPNKNCTPTKYRNL